MRKSLLLLAATALPLAACGYSSGTYGYDRYAYGYSPYSYSPYGYSPIIGAVGVLGSSSFSSAAANACANYAARYGMPRVTSVRPGYDRVHVYGVVSRGYRGDDWDCTVRSDGRISDFDI